MNIFIVILLFEVIVGINHAHQKNAVTKANSLVERMKHLLDTGHRADVYFLVGEGDEKELLPAHKAILEKASDLFEEMFRYDEGNAKSAAEGTGAQGWTSPVPESASRVYHQFAGVNLSIINFHNFEL
uniref:BTB domain-containing protein n=1 Tax=Globodera pallida TaxID=36090 RepID=A0A183BTW8_GLOPA